MNECEHEYVKVGYCEFESNLKLMMKQEIFKCKKCQHMIEKDK